MIEMRNEVRIERPVDQVWTYVGDPERWHSWRDAMSTQAEKSAEDPITVGVTYDYQSEFMGRAVETQFEVVAYQPQHRITVTAEVPVQVRLAFECERSNAGTRVVQETEGEVGGFFGIAEPLIKRLMKRQFQKDLNKLKDVVEGAA
jgi:uncharacterized protein YndB with AHSA1/START domain